MKGIIVCVIFETKGKGEGKVLSDDECMHGVIIYASLTEMINPSMFFFFVLHSQTILGCIVSYRRPYLEVW